ncbi:DUF2634 domain-containing protein [Ruminococcaceae bacterium OttesenSCG-928-I18]|nr:DUF2634 domain-containing protein [Ruminococcaceae bacterium OttesenSCG-928-I18]
MRGFKVGIDGDVVIENGLIQYAEGDELLRKTVEMVVGTNRGEWWLDEREGIDFSAILVKSPNMDLVRDEIHQALLILDDTFVIDSYEHELKDRRMSIRFTASNEAGRKISAETIYG